MRERLQPGDAVPSSGVYKVVHAPVHVQPHYVIALHGGTFPFCRECFHGVRFELALAALDLSLHPLFVSGGDYRENS